MLISRNKPSSRKAMISYLNTHTTTEGHFCQNVKFDHVLVDDGDGNPRGVTDVETEIAGKFFDAIGGSWDLGGIQVILDRFAEERRGYLIEAAGRSNRYMILVGMNANTSWNLLTTSSLKAVVDVVWNFDRTCLDATTAFLENAKAWVEGTKKVRYFIFFRTDDGATHYRDANEDVVYFDTSEAARKVIRMNLWTKFASVERAEF